MSSLVQNLKLQLQNLHLHSRRAGHPDIQAWEYLSQLLEAVSLTLHSLQRALLLESTDGNQAKQG
jgi:hypothetical protein